MNRSWRAFDESSRLAGYGDSRPPKVERITSPNGRHSAAGSSGTTISGGTSRGQLTMYNGWCVSICGRRRQPRLYTAPRAPPSLRTMTRTAAQIAEDSEMLGGTISAAVGSDSFGWSFSVPTARLGEALELLGDVVQRATFPDDGFETEKTVALSNIAMLRDDMYRYPLRLAMSAAFAGHPYGSPTMGTDESLRAITVDEARKWHKTRVMDSAAVIGIVADVDPHEAANMVAREFALLDVRKAPKAGKPRWPKRVKIAAESRDKAQTAMTLAFPAPSRSDDLRFAGTLLGTVASGLGGRFFDELRDRQSLAYTVHAAASEKRLAGIFVSYIATSPEKEGVARSGLLNEFAKLRETEVTPEELARAKQYVIGAHAIAQESGGVQLGEM